MIGGNVQTSDVIDITLRSDIYVGEVTDLVIPRRRVVVQDGVIPDGWVVYECTECLSRFRENLFSALENEGKKDTHICWTHTWDMRSRMSPSAQQLLYSVEQDGQTYSIGVDAGTTWQVSGRQLGKTKRVTSWVPQEFKTQPVEEPPYHEDSGPLEKDDLEILTSLLPPGYKLDKEPILTCRYPPNAHGLELEVKAWARGREFREEAFIPINQVFTGPGSDVRWKVDYETIVRNLVRDVAYHMRKDFDERG